MPLLSFDGAPHGGRQRHLPEWQSQPRISPTTIIDHSIVGTGEQGFDHFNERSVLESHFIVCGAGDIHDGEIWQLMDTGRQADANLNGNSYAISIETGDRGDPDTQPWTNAQVESLAWLHDELVRVHPTIPRRKSRSCSDPGGLGYHTLHGAPSCWTPVSKSCPGRVRKIQWAARLLLAFLNPQATEDDMPYTDWPAADRQALVDDVWRQISRGEKIDGTTPDHLAAASLAHPQEGLHRKVDLLWRGTTPGTGDSHDSTSIEGAITRLDDLEGKVDLLLAALPDPIAEPPPVP